MCSQPGRRTATAAAPSPISLWSDSETGQPSGAATAVCEQTRLDATAAVVNHDDRACWTALGVRMGFTSEQSQRTEIFAAIGRMRWTEPSPRLSRLGGSAARAVVNAVLHRRRNELNRLGVADLPGDRRLIGLEDTAGVASFVLDLGTEAICVLTISLDSSPASTSSSARHCDAVEDVR